MPLNFDIVAFSSNQPAFRNGDSGTLTVNVSGDVGAGSRVNWSGVVAFAKTNRMVRYSLKQSPVPAGFGYSAGTSVPVHQMVGGSSQSTYVSSTVDGVGAVNIAPNIYITSNGTTATARVSIFNPNAGTMHLTPTTFTFSYTAFEVIGES